MLHRLIQWIELYQAPCSWKSTFGIDCPGCGMQTAFIELLKGHIGASLVAFPALLPMIALLSMLFLHLVLKFRNGAAILKFLFIFTVSIMLFSYIIKLFTR